MIKLRSKVNSSIRNKDDMLLANVVSIMQASWSRMIVHAQHIDCITLNYIIVFSWISWTILSLLVDLWFTKCWTPNVETNSRLNVTHTLLPCSYNVVTVLFLFFCNFCYTYKSSRLSALASHLHSSPTETYCGLRVSRKQKNDTVHAPVGATRTLDLPQCWLHIWLAAQHLLIMVRHWLHTPEGCLPVRLSFDLMLSRNYCTGIDVQMRLLCWTIKEMQEKALDLCLELVTNLVWERPNAMHNLVLGF